MGFLSIKRTKIMFDKIAVVAIPNCKLYFCNSGNFKGSARMEFAVRCGRNFSQKYLKRDKIGY